MTTKETKFISENAGLIHKIANQFYGVEKEDLYQAGKLAVLDAMRNYKDDGKTKFSTYVYFYIFGEMYKLASGQKQIKVSKDLLKLYKLIEKTRYALAQKLNRVPSYEEVAIYLNQDVQEVLSAVQAGSLLVASLDKQESDERSFYETIPSYDTMSIDDRLEMEESMRDLTEEENQIIHYRYFEDLTQSEVARKLKMTQVMVSRYEKKGIDKMRAYYTMS